jgi:hypothetical protein
MGRPPRRLRRPIEVHLPSPKELRVWAKNHGFNVADRARIPTEIEVEYMAWAIKQQRRREAAESR